MNVSNPSSPIFSSRLLPSLKFLTTSSPRSLYLIIRDFKNYNKKIHIIIVSEREREREVCVCVCLCVCVYVCMCVCDPTRVYHSFSIKGCNWQKLCRRVIFRKFKQFIKKLMKVTSALVHDYKLHTQLSSCPLNICCCDII